MKQPLELTVMMYHYVRDPGDAAEAGSGIPGLPTDIFERQLDELSKKDTFVSWVEVRQAVQENRSLPPSPCLLSFDDGMIDHYVNVFRILRNRKLSGLFFALDRCESDELVLAHKIHFLLARIGIVGLREAIRERIDPAQRERFIEAEKEYTPNFPASSDQVNLLKAVLQRNLSADVNPILSELFEIYVGSESETARKYYLSREQIREMAAGGMHFGGHSRNHPWFDFIDVKSREAEIKASAAWLREIEPGSWAFAYPYGGLSGDSPGILQKHGFIAAFTTKTQLAHSDPYYIGRLDGDEIAQKGQENA